MLCDVIEGRRASEWEIQIGCNWSIKSDRSVRMWLAGRFYARHGLLAICLWMQHLCIATGADYSHQSRRRNYSKWCAVDGWIRLFSREYGNYSCTKILHCYKHKVNIYNFIKSKSVTDVLNIVTFYHEFIII